MDIIPSVKFYDNLKIRYFKQMEENKENITKHK